MRQINNDKLKTILENHLHWIREDCVGCVDMRADLSRVDLSRSNLSEANLCGANLSKVQPVRGQPVRG